MAERRFNEAEVAAIFERAVEAQQESGQRQLPSGEGLTLAELQDIGREVGISPELVGRAALAIDRRGTPTARKFLGLPVGVGRTVELDRKLTDEEWERFVVDLRETFDARGSLKQDGSLRQWTNGNLQVLLEPTATGHRIRFKTIKQDARSMIGLGAAWFGIGTTILIYTAMSGGDVSALSASGLLTMIGLGSFSAGALRLPGWAKTRERQMEDLATRIAGVASAKASNDPLLGK